MNKDECKLIKTGLMIVNELQFNENQALVYTLYFSKRGDI